MSVSLVCLEGIFGCQSIEGSPNPSVQQPGALHLAYLMSQTVSDMVKVPLDDTGSAAAEGRQAEDGPYLVAVLFTHQGSWAVPSALIAVL